MTEYFCAKYTPSGFKQVSESFSSCEGKITLFSFPNNPALREQWMQFVFPEQVCVFVPGHEWKPQAVSETASNVCFVGNRSVSAYNVNNTNV